MAAQKIITETTIELCRWHVKNWQKTHNVSNVKESLITVASNTRHAVRTSCQEEFSTNQCSGAMKDIHQCQQPLDGDNHAPTVIRCSRLSLLVSSELTSCHSRVSVCTGQQQVIRIALALNSNNFPSSNILWHTMQ